MFMSTPEGGPATTDSLAAAIRVLGDAKPGTRLIWSAVPDGTIVPLRTARTSLWPHRPGEHPLWTFDKGTAQVSDAQLLAKA